MMFMNFRKRGPTVPPSPPNRDVISVSDRGRHGKAARFESFRRQAILLTIAAVIFFILIYSLAVDMTGFSFGSLRSDRLPSHSLLGIRFDVTIPYAMRVPVHGNTSDVGGISQRDGTVEFSWNAIKKERHIYVTRSALTTTEKEGVLFAAAFPASLCSAIPHEWSLVPRAEMEMSHCLHSRATGNWKSAVCRAVSHAGGGGGGAAGSCQRATQPTQLLKDIEVNSTRIWIAWPNGNESAWVDGGIAALSQGLRETDTRCSWLSKDYTVGLSRQPFCKWLCMQKGFDFLVVREFTDIATETAIYAPSSTTPGWQYDARPRQPPKIAQSFPARPVFFPSLFPSVRLETATKSPFVSMTTNQIQLSGEALNVCKRASAFIDAQQCLLAGYREPNIHGNRGSAASLPTPRLSLTANGKLSHPTVLYFGHSHGRYLASFMCLILRSPACTHFTLARKLPFALSLTDIPDDVVAHSYAALAAAAAAAIRRNDTSYAGKRSRNRSGAKEEAQRNDMMRALADLYESGSLESRPTQSQVEKQKMHSTVARLRTLLDTETPLMTFIPAVYGLRKKIARMHHFYKNRIWERSWEERARMNADERETPEDELIRLGGTKGNTQPRMDVNLPHFSHVMYTRGTWDALVLDAPPQEKLLEYQEDVHLLLSNFPKSKLVVTLPHYHHDVGGGPDDRFAHYWRKHCYEERRIVRLRALNLCGAHRARQQYETELQERLKREGNALWATTKAPPIYILDYWYASATPFSKEYTCKDGHHYRDVVLESLTMRFLNIHLCPESSARFGGVSDYTQRDDELSWDNQMVGTARSVLSDAEDVNAVVEEDEDPNDSSERQRERTRTQRVTHNDLLGKLLSEAQGEAACAALTAIAEVPLTDWCMCHDHERGNPYKCLTLTRNVPQLMER